MLPNSQQSAMPWIKVPQLLAFSLSPELLAVYMRIACFDWGNGCWASVDRLRAGLYSDRQMRRYIHQLWKMGLISVQRRDGKTLMIRLLPVTPDMFDDEPRSSATGVTPSDPGHGLPGKKNKGVTKKKNIEEQQQSPPDPMPELPLLPTEEAGAAAPEKETCPPQPEPQPEPKPGVVVSLKNLDQEKKRTIIKGMIEAGVTELAAHQLAKSYPLDRIEDQLRWLPFRPPAQNKAGLLVKSIKENFSAPPAAIAREAVASKEVETKHQEEAAPPPGARWAMRRDSGDRYPIVEIRSDYVRTDRFIIAPHQWPNWVWIETDE